jgi:phage tail sheath protein FI
MVDHKTPGVYIVEKNAFPNSVVEVATAVPAFIGYTEKAIRGTQTLTDIPVRITSLAEFEVMFGGPPPVKYGRATPGGPIQAKEDAHFMLYYSMRFFFDNGGSTCWIVSVGPYADETGTLTAKAGSDLERGLGLLTKEPEPTILVAPDAVTLPLGEWKSLCEQMYAQCIDMQSRVAIFDVLNGDLPRNSDKPDPVKVFRDNLSADQHSYGMAYYPWLNTAVVEANELDYRDLDPTLAGELDTAIRTELDIDNAKPDDKPALEEMVKALKSPPAKDADARRQHDALMTLSPTYTNIMAEVLKVANVMPPAAGMAGVFARTDALFGVWKAPANTPMKSVLSPCVTISHDEQEDLNVPMHGKAINAIRSFMGRGVLVWGARTLDGNSHDWRYVSVRRTMIFLEQSIKNAAQAYVFAPNTSGTWITVANMIRNFLNNQWKAGALVGATPDEAYQVSVGLGATMTDSDILDGLMRVTVKVAVSRPAEFIEITFQQKMQTS